MMKIKTITNIKGLLVSQKVKGSLLPNQNHSGSLSKTQAYNRYTMLPFKSYPSPQPFQFFLKLIRTNFFLATIPFCFSHGPPISPVIFSEDKGQHSEEIQISSQLIGAVLAAWAAAGSCQSTNLQPGLFQTGRALETRKETPWQGRRHPKTTIIKELYLSLVV